jgi:Polysaccharide lyase
VVTILLFEAVACRAQGVSLREGFEKANLAQWALAPCYRPENSITRSPPANSGDFSAGLEVWPLGKSQSAQEAPLNGISCLDGNRPRLPVIPDGTERAEVWVPAGSRLPVDTDLWYGFSMLIVGTVKDDEPRLVIGQWKQSNGKSPILAQRFTHKTFAITAEQDGPNGLVCRILVAYQHGRAKPQDDSFLHGGPRSEVNTSGCMSETEIVQPDGTRGPAATLPDPFAGDCWIDMIYHLRASTEEAGAGELRPDGALEVWVNGAAVTVMRGRIGYYSDDPAKREGYFKFGPYRDADVGRDYATTVHFDSFARGSSYREVDPAHFAGRRLVTLCR